MEEIRIGGRTVPLTMTSWELETIQEEIGCTVGQLRDEVFGLEQDVETGEFRFGILGDGKKIRKFGSLIRILGNAGLEEAGKDPDLTDKWVLRQIKPGMIIPFVIAVSAVISEAMKMEAGEKNEGPVDEILEEENRKKEPES